MQRLLQRGVVDLRRGEGGDQGAYVEQVLPGGLPGQVQMAAGLGRVAVQVGSAACTSITTLARRPLSATVRCDQTPSTLTTNTVIRAISRGATTSPRSGSRTARTTTCTELSSSTAPIAGTAGSTMNTCGLSTNSRNEAVPLSRTAGT
ncbi:hypothetical protein [Micromonospora craniellae]|uniref:hypothetical protein n=1 Tax=Micromonospora craniellae TaxID=2294034 RepID=UPI001CC578F7|nr:hypothetical protein [Micromonospora craniellae]